MVISQPRDNYTPYEHPMSILDGRNVCDTNLNNHYYLRVVEAYPIAKNTYTVIFEVLAG